MTIWNGLTSDGAVVPIQVDDQGRVVAVGSGPDSPLVVDGDYLRPRDPALGLGTANINLDADGSAEFAGTIQTDGWFQSDRTSATGSILYGRLSGTEKVNIRAGGSASFADSVGIGGTLNADASLMNIALESDGTATFDNVLTSNI